jgi:hypothetical protein
VLFFFSIICVIQKILSIHIYTGKILARK